MRGMGEIQFSFETLNELSAGRQEKWKIRVGRQESPTRRDREQVFILPVGKTLKDLCDGIDKWQAGSFVQDALGWLDADSREFLMTGITKEEWDEIFSEEESE